ncbi:sigma factor-like helix-turn-helix DNA-binding protein [Streptomyces europaeiscabiei]|uniref:sigma factor-like helix-turn-helix DNA-binding protein n=1 Tax=Streptomyces europaeiscabiei TaxID=146819 RepID=UPI0038F6684D
MEQLGAWLAKVVTHLCLTSTERAVYVPREVFAYGYREIAAVLDLTEADCRQLYRRAAGRVAVRFAGGLDFSVAEVDG